MKVTFEREQQKVVYAFDSIDNLLVPGIAKILVQDASKELDKRKETNK